MRHLGWVKRLMGGRHVSDFLLKPGELLEVVKGEMQIVAYEHGLITEPGPCVRQRLCAVRSEVPAQLG